MTNDELIARLEAAQDEEMKAATGTLAEAIKDLKRAGFRDAAELLEVKTMPETIAVFRENRIAALRAKDQADG